MQATTNSPQVLILIPASKIQPEPVSLTPKGYLILTVQANGNIVKKYYKKRKVSVEISQV